MLIQYLTSPIWKIPIYEFLDEHCIIFDDEEENKFEYTDIHNVNIKNLKNIFYTSNIERYTPLHFFSIEIQKKDREPGGANDDGHRNLRGTVLQYVQTWTLEKAPPKDF